MKILFYTDLKSHPDKLLEQHLENVGIFSKNFFNSLEIDNNNLFAEIGYLIGISHDFAKSTSFFQNHLLENIGSENSQHSFLSAIFSYYVINNYLIENNIKFNQNLALISYIVVLHHHGNIRDIPQLLNYHDNKTESKVIKSQINNLIHNDGLKDYYLNKNINLEDFFDNFNQICDDISDDLFDLEGDINLDYYFTIFLFYSTLLDADKMDASQSDFIQRNNIADDIVDNYKIKHNFNQEGINKIREESYVEVNKNIQELDLSNKIYSINLPTGIGKTLTGLSATLKLKKRINDEFGFNPRIIYSLPFLSVIDQNESVIRDIFNENDLNGTNFLLKHNYLSNMKYINNDNEFLDMSNSKILIEGWNSEFIITTFIQFFNSLIGNKNAYIRKFHNIVNSIIILDEIQSIPHNYWRVINKILTKLAHEYNCWIILMTATQPLIFSDNEINPLVDNSDFYFNQFDRIDYNFHQDSLVIDDFNRIIIDDIENEPDKDFLIVLNTIGSSKEVYEFIKDYYSNQNHHIFIDEEGICHINDEICLIYLSTNITPYNRLKKINFIKNSNKQNIIVSTQLIEAGVDIDVDIVYRDFAPLDSIIQTAGRCNRNGSKQKGVVNIISLVNDKGKSYSSFVYHSLLLSTTKEVIKDLVCVSEKDFNLSSSKNYFELISKRSFDDENLNNSLKYLKFENIQSNFKLIKNLPNKIDVFVCINKKASEIFDAYKNIVDNLKGFEKKEAFLEIKNDFYKYVISVDEKQFGSTNIFNDEIGVIYSEDLDRKYKIDLGFIGSDDEEPLIW